MSDTRGAGAVEATEQALANVKVWNADTKALITVTGDGCAEHSQRHRRAPASRRVVRASRRHDHEHQGQRRRGGRGDDGWLENSGRQHRQSQLVHRRAPEAARCRDCRQSQSARMGVRPDEPEHALRSGAKSLGHHPHSRWLERRLRCFAGGADVRGIHRQRHGRIDPDSFRVLRRRGIEAHDRAHLLPWQRPRQCVVRYGRTDGAACQRRGAHLYGRCRVRSRGPDLGGPACSKCSRAARYARERPENRRSAPLLLRRPGAGGALRPWTPPSRHGADWA